MSNSTLLAPDLITRSVVQKRARFRPELPFLTISLVFGSLFLLTTPPFQVADESRHFARAYQLSEQGLHAVGFIPVPIALPRSVVRAIEQTAYLRNETGPTFTVDQLTTLIGNPLRPEQRTKFDERASYSFVAYLPQILVIMPLRLANVNAVLTLYVARLAALLFWVLLTYWAIRLTPIAKRLLFFIALLPMTLFQAASLSADSVTFALSFLLTALYLRLAYGSPPVSTRQLLMVAGLGTALTAAKFVYAPLIGLHFLIPRARFRSPAVYGVSFLLTACLCLLVVAAPFNSLFTFVTTPFTQGESTAVSGGLTPYPQLNFLLADPLNILRTVTATVGRFGRSYLDGFVGNLGWYGASLPSYLYIVTAILLWLTALTTRHKFRVSWGQKIVMLVTVLVMTALICAGICTDLRENPLPTLQMRGIQGRYFTPFALLIGLLAANQLTILLRYQRFVQWITVPFLLFLLTNAFWCLLIRYYG